MKLTKTSLSQDWHCTRKVSLIPTLTQDNWTITIVHWRPSMMLKIHLLIFSETSTGSACHLPLYANIVPTVRGYTKRELDRCVAGEPRWTVSVMPLAYTHICIRERNSVIMGYYQYFVSLTGSLPANCSGGRCLLQHQPMSHGNWCTMYWPTFANCCSGYI